MLIDSFTRHFYFFSCQCNILMDPSTVDNEDIESDVDFNEEKSSQPQTVSLYSSVLYRMSDEPESFYKQRIQKHRPSLEHPVYLRWNNQINY